MLYVVVAITAVLAVLITVLLKNLSSAQSSTTTSKWNLDDSNGFRRRTQSIQSPSVNYNQHLKHLQKQNCSYSPMANCAPNTPNDGNRQTTLALVRSSEVSPSGVVSNDRSLFTRESADRTTQPTPVTIQSSVISPSTAECYEWRYNVNEPSNEQSATQTPTQVRSNLVVPTTVKIQEMNKKPIESETRLNEGMSSNKSMNSNKESGVLHFTRNTDVSNTETRGFAARRTFSGSGSDVWLEFIRYFENLLALNNWSQEKVRRKSLCLLRGQAESFAYGLPLEVQSSWVSLKAHMEERFGLLAMRDSYIA